MSATKTEGEMMQGSIASLRTDNPIRKIVDRLDMSNLREDKAFISLSIGDPTKYPNLRPSSSVTLSVGKALLSESHNGYGPSSGLGIAKSALLEKYSMPHIPQMDHSDVYLTSGCSDALNIALCSVLNIGDSILLPKPGFSLYGTLCHRYDFGTVYYNCLPHREWEIDLAHLEEQVANKANKVKCILINNPSNPCGSVLSRKNIVGVLRIARKHRLVIISDEVYDGMVFDSAASSYARVASLTSVVPVPVITVGGLAKQYLVPGWRLGWILLYDPLSQMGSVKQGMDRLATLILGPNTVVQAALPGILRDTPSAYYTQLNGMLQEQALCLYAHFDGTRELQPIVPKGAMYLMTRIKMEMFAKDDIGNDIDFCNKLLQEESVFVLPGTIFGMPDYFRSVVCPPTDVLDVVGQRVKAFCRRHAINQGIVSKL